MLVDKKRAFIGAASRPALKQAKFPALKSDIMAIVSLVGWTEQDAEEVQLPGEVCGKLPVVKTNPNPVSAT